MNYKLILPENYVKPKLLRRDKWTAALRSGEYEQGYGKLQNEGKFCCLGVLCKIEKSMTPYSVSLLPPPTPQFSVLKSAGDFPVGVRVTLDEGHPAATGTCLVNCNDNGLTFHQIADIIESVWENEENEAV